jgi:hypothetical protein
MDSVSRGRVCDRLGDLLVDPVQRLPRPVGLLAAVDDQIAALRADRAAPGLGDDIPVRNLLLLVLPTSLVNDTGNTRDLIPRKNEWLLNAFCIHLRDYPASAATVTAGSR